MQVNPFANVKRKTSPQRKVVWTEDDVRQFLDTAYGDFQWRSIGLIVHMAYEWCQRLGDMRLLTWDNIDLEAKKLYLEQSKRRAEVTLPIQDDLLEMLVQQEQDFGFSTVRCSYNARTRAVRAIQYGETVQSRTGRYA